MVLYNVTVKIEASVHDEWLEWMRNHHIPEVMATGYFLENKICRLLHDEEDGFTYAFQYLCKDLATFQAYQNNEAPRLQADHASRFPNQYVAFRTLMEVIG